MNLLSPVHPYIANAAKVIFSILFFANIGVRMEGLSTKEEADEFGREMREKYPYAYPQEEPHKNIRGTDGLC